MKLYVYRNSQCRGLQDAWVDGAIRYLGTFDMKTAPGEFAAMEAKQVALVIAEMIDNTEDLVFIEVSEPGFLV